MDLENRHETLNARLLSMGWSVVAFMASILVLYVTGLLWVAADTEAPTWLTAVALIFMADSVSMAWFFPRIARRSPAGSYVLSLAFAATAALIGGAAAASGAPEWLAWLGLALSVAALVLVAYRVGVGR